MWEPVSRWQRRPISFVAEELVASVAARGRLELGGFSSCTENQFRSALMKRTDWETDYIPLSDVLLFLSSSSYVPCSLLRRSAVIDRARLDRKKRTKKEQHIPLWKRGSRARCVNLVAEDLPTDCNHFQAARPSSGNQRVWVRQRKHLTMRATMNSQIAHRTLGGFPFPVLPDGRLQRMLPAGVAKRIADIEPLPAFVPCCWPSSSGKGKSNGRFIDIRFLFSLPPRLCLW